MLDPKVVFPNESLQYRAARDELLRREIGLRREMECVAVARRALPRGSVLQEDYVFDELDDHGAVIEVRLSRLAGISSSHSRDVPGRRWRNIEPMAIVHRRPRDRNHACDEVATVDYE